MAWANWRAAALSADGAAAQARAEVAIKLAAPIVKKNFLLYMVFNP
jgi:hypothetical protein